MANDEKSEKDQAGAKAAEPKYDAKADKEYEQRRAGLLPANALLDRIVLAGRKAKAEAEQAARAVRERAIRARRGQAERVEAP